MRHSRRCLVNLLGFALLVLAEHARAEDKQQHNAAIQAYLKQHCTSCHGAEKQESKLRLDTIAHDFRTGATLKSWARVLERVEAGEMPPEDRPRPEAKSTEQFVLWVRQHLQTATAEGTLAATTRGPRRLNRIEYQNTVTSLLDIDLNLANGLPEDGAIDGFDKVGQALSISPVLVERYLEVAELAVQEALADRPVTPSVTKRYNLWDCGVARRTLQKNGAWAENDNAGIAWYTNDKYFAIEPFKAPVRGKYRIRVAAYGTLLGGAQRTDDPVVMALHGGDFKSSNRVSHRIGFHSVPWDVPTVVEAVDLLEAGHSFKVTIAARPPYTYKIDEYVGTGLAVQWVDIEGPLPDEAPQRRRVKLLGSLDPTKATPADAERLLAEFTARAFRRPVDKATVAPYLALVREQFASGASFTEALAVGMKSLLCAPQFLFLEQRTSALDDYDIAARMSYFLWSAAPDDTLLGLAAEGRLRDPAVRREQVSRMLDDPRASALTHGFLDGWLDLKKIDFTTPDKELYPEFDEPLRAAMMEESWRFFETLVRDDLPATNVIDSKFAILNERLARHYGIAGVRGDEFRRVSLPNETPRGGFITQASVLKVTADGTVTSPVLRGVWLLDRIMHRPPPPPPPGVAGVEPDIRGATTVREQLAKHRQSANCATCHKKIDPPGFALESFDPIGTWREKYRVLDPDRPVAKPGVRYATGLVVDAGDELPDGRKFHDVREFKRLLLTEPRAIAEGLTAKLLTYALGRTPDFADQAEIETVLDRVEPKQFGVRSLIQELVASETFGSR